MYFFTALVSGLTMPGAAAQDRPPKNDSLALIYYVQATERIHPSDRDSAIAILDLAYERFAKRGYKKGQARIAHLLGSQYMTMAMFPQAEQLFSEAIRLLESLDEPRWLADAYSALGTVAGRSNDFQQATDRLLKARKIYEQVRDERGMSSIFLKLGNVYAMLGHNDQAIDYYNRALPLAEKLDSINTITLYSNIGGLYKDDKDYQKAISSFTKALENAQQYGLERLTVLPLINLGQTYLEMGNVPPALRCFDEGIAVAEKYGLAEELLTLQYQKASAQAESEPKVTLKVLADIASRADSMELRHISGWAQETMININREQGDYKAVAELQEHMFRSRDSVSKRNQLKEVAELEARFELEKSRETVSLLHERLDRKRKETYYIICLLLVAGSKLGITFLLYRKLKARNRILAESQAKLQEANDTKDRLFGIIGHDLNNGLRTLPDALRTYRKAQLPHSQQGALLDMIEQQLDNVNLTVDTLLNWGKLIVKGVVTQATAFDAALAADHEITALRFQSQPKSLSLQNLIPRDTIIVGDEAHFRFVLRNLLANAIKYSNNDQTITVWSGTDATAATLTFAVADNGIGMNNEELQTIFLSNHTSVNGTGGEEGNAIALMLCKAFIEKNDGHIRVESVLGKGSTFYFTFGTTSNEQVPML